MPTVAGLDEISGDAKQIGPLLAFSHFFSVCPKSQKTLLDNILKVMFSDSVIEKESGERNTVLLVELPDKLTCDFHLMGIQPSQQYEIHSCIA
jgi:hypothetical protein